ncbi:TrbG/VirB9 family P-type conjugative transfer protein [Duganella sp. HH105]|uniref:TrbG/VirB9 family P-type conjugative transfer protein n=1 Tax=Duganella sp. HH105 TaxID=1781067 RepID=UPI00089339AB|nr:TrbG/VirB9 family P-type conjugative transfer protein [Duganella sp. HH105]OEZ54867.1 type IV secretion system protein virB9 precursor [Duganella sp. HH105]
MKTPCTFKWILMLLCVQAGAAQTPQPVGGDPHIRYAVYRPDEVTVITVQRGTATRIVLAGDEKIQRDGTATGFPADCAKAELEWCMHAEPGSNQILVKPKDGATHNNLELRTDKRDYSFRFEVATKDGAARGGHASDSAMYRVSFRYPQTTRAQQLEQLLGAVNAQPAASNSAGVAIQDALPQPRNWRYTMQALPSAEDIVPAMVFDDGRFTYFQFPANRELPTIYYVSPSGEEARVNFHIDPQDAGLAVVERMGRRFVLRLGGATIGIWNDAFDSYGVPPKDGTTVDGLVRSVRKETP